MIYGALALAGGNSVWADIMVNIDSQIRAAGSSEGEELWAALRGQNPRVFEAAMSNLKLTVDMALFIAKSKNATPETLGAISSDARFRRSYKVVLALVKNARTPQRIANSLFKHIKVFDLADLSRAHYVNSVTRQKVELMLMERIPSLPAGVKSALSRRASARVILFIMERSDRRVADMCLGAPRITEDMVVRILQKPTVRAQLVRAVAEHRKWSTRYSVRYALIRNFHTPLGILEGLLPEMKVRDLRELYVDSGVPESTRPFIHSELIVRGYEVDIPDEVVYELDGDEGGYLSEGGDWELGCCMEEGDEGASSDGNDWELG